MRGGSPRLDLDVWDLGQYFRYLPRSPNPEAGSIYPLNIHGVVVYQTLKEQSRLDNWIRWSFGVFCCGMALGGIHKWKKDGTLLKRNGG
jgi:hypothetical protein